MRASLSKSVGIVTLVVTWSACPAQDLVKPFLGRTFTQKLLTEAELKPLFRADYELERNEGNDSVAKYLPQIRALIFGRRGRIFREPSLQAFLKEQPWYRPNPNFSNAVLTPMERTNIDLVRRLEADSHEATVPGDLRFFMNRPVVTKNHYYRLTDLRIMQAEIEAIHGKTFPSAPFLQRYFTERYWYRPDPSYDFKRLNATERANLAALRKLESGTHNDDWFDTSDVLKFDRAPIPEKLLDSLSIYELRLLRNAIYAMRGYRFRTPWIREHFASQEWYTPGEGEPKLTDMDQQNLRLVLRVEGARHAALSTKRLERLDLKGLFIEDLRRLAEEIPARNGKVFSDPSLRAYFTSLPWYRPNAKYREAQLNPIERENLKFLREAMQSTTRQFALEEG